MPHYACYSSARCETQPDGACRFTATEELTRCLGLDSQERYTYPGCDDAGSYGCPRSRVFMCALDSIREKYQACQGAADCVAVSADNCFGYLTSCPPAAVSDAGAAAFLAEANAEGRRYCDGGRCQGSGLCAYSYGLRAVACINARCVARSDDGGS